MVFGSFWGPSPILLVSDLIHSGACNLAELTEERGRVEKEASSGFESSCPSLGEAKPEEGSEESQLKGIASMDQELN